jgi:hypothetical protein
MADPLPMLQLFDKQVQLRMGQANVWRWVPDLLPLVSDGDPFGVDGFASHHLPLADAPQAYEKFQKKEDGFVKVLLQPMSGVVESVRGVLWARMRQPEEVASGIALAHERHQPDELLAQAVAAEQAGFDAGLLQRPAGAVVVTGRAGLVLTRIRRR